MNFALIVGIILTFWGGFDLAAYLANNNRRNLVYCVLTTSLGVLNILLGAGVIQ